MSKNVKNTRFCKKNDNFSKMAENLRIMHKVYTNYFFFFSFVLFFRHKYVQVYLSLVNYPSLNYSKQKLKRLQFFCK